VTADELRRAAFELVERSQVPATVTDPAALARIAAILASVHKADRKARR
jgi:hypothetical protein